MRYPTPRTFAASSYAPAEEQEGCKMSWQTCALPIAKKRQESFEPGIPEDEDEHPTLQK
jgi:hypothetical protein